MAVAAGLDLRKGSLGHRAGEQVVEHQGPVLPARDRHLHPDDGAAGGAGGARQPIDVGYDLAGSRDLDGRALGAEYVLHIDDDQRGLARIDGLKAVQVAAAEDDAIDYVGGQLSRVHADLLA
jgi:hypothetical protein